MALSQLLIFCLTVLILQAVRLRRWNTTSLKFLTLLVCILVNTPGFVASSRLAASNYAILTSDLQAIEAATAQNIDKQCTTIEISRYKPSTQTSVLRTLNTASGEQYTSILKAQNPHYFSLEIDPEDIWKSKRNRKSKDNIIMLENRLNVSTFAYEQWPLETFFDTQPCVFLRYSYLVYSDDFSRVPPTTFKLKGYTLKGLYQGRAEALDRLERE